MFQHNIHKYARMSPDGKTYNQIDHILRDRWSHSSVLNVTSFKAADCDTDHYLVVVEVREWPSVSKQSSQRFHMGRFNLKKLNEVEQKEKYCVEVSNKFAAFLRCGPWGGNSAWETIRENIKISSKESLGYFELKHNPWFDEGCSTLLDQRKQTRLEWLQDPSEINWDDLNNVRLEASRHSGKKWWNAWKTNLMNLHQTVRRRITTI
jgi:hypothetical protein